MKKYILLLLIVIPTAVYPQITFTQADVPPLGSYWNMTTDTLPSDTITPGTGGPNRIWDFSKSLRIKRDYTIALADPLATPRGDAFSGIANIAVIGNKYTTYLNSSATSAEYVGYISRIYGDTIIFKYTNNQTLMPFPAGYLTTLTDTSIFDIRQKYDTIILGFTIDSLRYKQVTLMLHNYDSWGKVILPSDSFDVIRNYRREFRIDSIWMHTKAPFVMWQNISATRDTNYFYEYIGKVNGYRHNVLTIKWDSLHNKAETIDWYKDYLVATEKTEKQKEYFYPNPADQRIYFESSNIKQAIIFNAEAKQIIRVRQPKTISVAHLPAGVYYIQYVVNEKIETRQLIILH